MASYRPVISVLRCLDVLAAVNRLSGRASLAEIHRQVGLDKATILRMLETLAHAGFVVRDDDTRLYHAAGKTLQLSAGYRAHSAIGAAVSPRLGDFRRRIGWPSDVAIRDGDAMIVVETSREAGPMFVNRGPGYRAPLLATSLGRAYTAFCGPAERAKILETVATDPAPWNDISRDRAGAEAAFAQIRAAGYATMDGSYMAQEYENRISSVGVPIRDGETIFACINVLYLRTALSAEDAAISLTAPLQEIAAALSADLARQSAA
ncbi:MAG: helix-turn-helix domain-containing protein [Thalassobaculaceae bacterium]|nr:helix-turn-helix domain-containing protein [Thalassobaculaceae bacterium]